MSVSVFIHTHCCSTMELKATSVLLLMCVAIIILTSTEVGAIPSCCLNLSKKIPKSMLRSVSRYEFQSKSGHCDTDAVILHIKKRQLCAHPKVLKFLEKPKKNRKLKRTQKKTE